MDTLFKIDTRTARSWNVWKLLFTFTTEKKGKIPRHAFCKLNFNALSLYAHQSIRYFVTAVKQVSIFHEQN